MGMTCGYVVLSSAEVEKARKDPEFAEELFFEDPDERSADIDKAWHGIHFLLTGESEEANFPLGFILSGGESVGAEQDDLPTTRLFGSSDVKKIAQALEKIDTEVLRSRFNANNLKSADIYPDIWDDEESVDYLLENYAELKQAILNAARNEQALLVQIG